MEKIAFLNSSKANGSRVSVTVERPWVLPRNRGEAGLGKSCHSATAGLGTSATCGDCELRSAYEARAVARPMPPRWRSAESFQAAGRMFWFTRNRLAGSYFFLSVARRL